MQFKIVEHEGVNSITVYLPGRDPQTATDKSHKNYDEIKKAVVLGETGEDRILDLFDAGKAVARKFDGLSERVAVKNGAVYFDGDVVDNALSKQILRFLSEDVDDWKPLVNFFEKVQQNPTVHSQQQLYTFLNRHQITIADDGDIVAYKGMVKSYDEDGDYYYPTTHGHIIVDGEDFANSGEAKQRIGSIVTMPRSEVNHNPNQGCSVGLHVATFSFAKGYGGTVLEVRVNPRDVVSVPASDTQKVRACRYVIQGEIENPYSTAVIGTPIGEDNPEPEPVEAVVATLAAEGLVESVEVPVDVQEEIAPFGYRPVKRGEFETLAAEAKLRKKGLAKLAVQHDWKLVGEDPKDHRSWERPRAKAKR